MFFHNFFSKFTRIFGQNKDILEYLEYALQKPSIKRTNRTFLRFPFNSKNQNILNRFSGQIHLDDAQWSLGNLGWFDSTTSKRKELGSLKRLFPYSFHLQSFSSCVPVEWMDIKVPLTVADLCASPGSKSIQLIEALSSIGIPKSFLWVCELNPRRFHHLESNMKLNVSPECKKLVNVNLSLRNSIVPLKKYRDFFDLILLDAPCSGEGIISSNNLKSFSGWSVDIVNRNVHIQRLLLESAIEQLKPGGTLIYSTCTLNPYENEEQIEYVLSRFPQMKLGDMPATFTRHLITAHQLSSLKEFDLPFLPGMNFGNLDLSNCLRIMPSSLYEGFFIAKLTKEE